MFQHGMAVVRISVTIIESKSVLVSIVRILGQ